MTGRTRRLFVAVDPSPDVRRWLVEMSDTLREACREQGLRARFVKPENLHLTLRFLGDVEEGLVPALIEALGEVATTDRLEIRFSGLGAFPDEKKPRVLWVGLGEGRKSMKTLAEQVDRCLQGAGIAPEERPFTPHLTLARIKNRSENTARLMKSVSPRGGPSSPVQEIREVVLYESDLGPTGARYTPRARISVGGAGK